MKRFILLVFVAAGFFPALFCESPALAANNPVEHWARFKQSLTSSKDYDNPVQQIGLKVEFTAPSKSKRTLLAFWDGGQVWRVRFSPDEQGRWTYKTTCSDQSNKGLHNQAGSFRCEKYDGDLPLLRHGELRLSSNRRYIEHADGSPFFWLAEYMIARYGAHQVIWFLGGDGNYSGENAETWKRIGSAVFNEDQHRLATQHVRGKSWVGKEFRNESWFSFIGYQSGHGDDEGTFRWLNQGPPATEWNNKPGLPVINTEPNYEAHNGYKYRKVHNDHSVRRAAYWSLLVSPTAGVTYGGQGIWGWHTKVQVPAAHKSAGLGSPWHVAKDLPGALSMKYLHQFFKSIEWWRLIPAQEVLAGQPGKDDASKFIAAAKSKEGDLLVVYLPEGGPVTLKTDSLEKGLSARWYHPRTGGWLDAGKVAKPRQTFKTVDKNDWILLIDAE